jgi:PAS domain S-box-containing protein
MLAVLQIFRSWQPFGWGMDPAFTLDLLNFLVPLLMLASMVHIELLFRERLRLEEEEKKLRGSLEEQVKARTSELDQANEELQHEITLRRSGEQELRNSKEQYRFLFDENPQPMWIFDRRTFEFVAFNTAALRHYGFTKAEFSKLTARDLCFEVDFEAFEAEAERNTPDVPRRNIWRHLRRDGAVIEVELTSRDLVYNGCPARLVLARDVTAERVLQKQMLQAQRAEVTAQLAGGVADNFSRLLAGIESDANGLMQKCEDAAMAEPLKRMAATAASAGGLTQQLLALVKRHPMRPQSLDLNKFVEGQTVAISRQLGDKVKLEKSCWLNLPQVTADSGLLEQVVRHLVTNALEAMPEGGVLTFSTAAVRVDEEHARLHDGARAGTYACLTISDTGHGMTPEVQEHLFEPFFTTKGPGKAGLGLATAVGLVKQHSGWIEVSSQPGAGSQFAVFLPCTAAPVTVRETVVR